MTPPPAPRRAAAARTLPVLLAAAAAALLHAPAAAQGEPGRPADATTWGLGLVVIPDVRPYRGVARETQVWPALSFENRWVRLIGPGLELKLGQAGPVAFGLTARYEGQGYEAGDSPFLAGMDKRRAGAWVGARAALRSGFGTLSTEWSTDAEGHSRGQKLRLGVDRRFPLGGLGLTPRLAATWHDSRFTRYYYGVEPAEVRADRPAYRPGSAVDTELGLRIDLRFTPQTGAFLDLGVTELGRAIRDSPLVDRQRVPQVRIGTLTRF